jgi:hypothetical protein
MYVDFKIDFSLVEGASLRCYLWLRDKGCRDVLTLEHLCAAAFFRENVFFGRISDTVHRVFCHRL